VTTTNTGKESAMNTAHTTIAYPLTIAGGSLRETSHCLEGAIELAELWVRLYRTRRATAVVRVIDARGVVLAER
jgi:hypothetical protein